MKQFIFPLVVALLLSSCTPSMHFLPSTVVPAATGKVQIKRDKNSNYIVRVDVQNLAPADRLTPPQRTYIVWMESGRNSIKKLGLLEPRSKNLVASLNTSTVTKPDRLFVTAEYGPDSQYPAGTEVLATGLR